MADLENKVLLLLLRNRKMLIDEIMAQTRCSEEVLQSILEKNEMFLRKKDLEIIVERPLELALMLIERGIEVLKISELLDWRDFEKLSSSILREHGYNVVANARLTSPVRVEIDVVGVNPVNGLALIIDCKHWSTMTRSRLVEVARDHEERLLKLIKYYRYFKDRYKIFEKAKFAVPLIITLLTPGVRVHGNVIVISIKEFNEFLSNTYLVLDNYGVKPIRLRNTLG